MGYLWIFIISIYRYINDLTRQLSFLMNNYKYELGEDPENKCIMIPRYKALGRMSPDGKRYPDKEISKPSEEDLVPVRSIITKFTNRDIVTPDLIGTKFKDITHGAGIGLSFGTSLTENITQSALGLKHGGHERVIDENGYLYAPRACKVREEGQWLYLDYKGGSLKYPRPDNLVLNAKESFAKGDLVGTAYSTTSPIYRLNALINLMSARGSDGKRYFEKDNVIVSDCYAYQEGEIHYIENPRTKRIEVQIGSVRYDYNPQCMYFFPEGSHVKKLERFCSGVVNMHHVINDLGDNIRDIYLIFRKQFYFLTDGTYRKTGITELSAPQEELVEMLFISLINVDYNPKKGQIENIDYLGTYSGVMSNDSFYTILSYGWSGRVVQKALRGEAGLKNDVMTETVLGLLLNDKLDDPMLPK